MSLLFRIIEDYILMGEEKVTFESIIDKDDMKLLKNRRVRKMSKIDWGKTISITNQYIHCSILKYYLNPSGYRVYTTDDINNLKYNEEYKGDYDIILENEHININNNSPGFDLIVICPNNKIHRIQSKLRQVEGTNDTSCAIHFETTRRNSKKNANRNNSGHIVYSSNEFDFVLLSLINVKNNDRTNINDCNKWSFCLIETKELIDEDNKDACINRISSAILNKNLIQNWKDILTKL